MKEYGINLDGYDLPKTFKRKVINNLVESELGLHILNESKRDVQPELFR